MIIIFTGNGKGKTTAALGQALRAVGNDSKVLMVQFIKGPWESGEHRSAEKLAPNLKIVRKGRGFVRICGDKLPFEEHIKSAREAVAHARRAALTRHWNIIILDEIWNALKLELLTEEEIEKAIGVISLRVDHLILTGRDCPPRFIEIADLVTEMREIKHPYLSGVKAAKNVEF